MHLRLRLAVGTLLLAVTACLGSNEEVGTTNAEHRVKASDLSDDDARSLTFIRRVVEDYMRMDAARAAGYTSQQPEGCVQTPSGAHGFHYVNPGLLDAKVELNRPEALMYEAQIDGSMMLIGVDYVVPFDKWREDQPPRLIGRRFLRNDSLRVWSLHVWTHRDNPNGVFAMYNPNVACRVGSG